MCAECVCVRVFPVGWGGAHCHREQSSPKHETSLPNGGSPVLFYLFYLKSLCNSYEAVTFCFLFCFLQTLKYAFQTNDRLCFVMEYANGGEVSFPFCFLAWCWVMSLLYFLKKKANCKFNKENTGLYQFMTWNVMFNYLVAIRLKLVDERLKGYSCHFYLGVQWRIYKELLSYLF